MKAKQPPPQVAPIGFRHPSMRRRGAYKDIDAVMAAKSDLVEIVHTLRQVLCVKG